MMANLSLPLKAIRMQVASALNLIVHIERMRDGIRRVQKIAEVGWVGGDAISMRDLFTFEHRGERRDGTIEGVFESSRMRPDLAVRAAQFGLERQLLEALGVTAG
jgi:pilus assembly protein CpaF